MKKITGNEPINPVNGASGVLFSPEDKTNKLFIERGMGYSGLTIRQQFASMAMQGILALPERIEGTTTKQPEFIAKISVMMADALIAELNK